MKQKLNEEEILEYLDKSIEKWRNINNDPQHEYNHMAIYYIDAFQSVRVSIFGMLKSKKS